MARSPRTPSDRRQRYRLARHERGLLLGDLPVLARPLPSEAALPDGQRLNANALATELNRRQIKAPRGGKWAYSTASRLLKRVRQTEKREADNDEIS